jgi:GNAT superfamily N-acetyltransferase
MEINEDYDIRLVNNEIYINRLADLHLSAFRKLLSGRIGKRYLRCYYRRIIEGGFVYACFEGDRIAGFVSGIVNEKRLYNIKYYFCAILGIITHIYSIRMILGLYRHVLRIIKVTDVKIKSELLSIVVDEKSRGKGIGKALVERFNDFMVEKKVSRYKVFTDMEYSTGHRLYEKLGYILDRELRVAGLTVRMYVKELKQHF